MCRVSNMVRHDQRPTKQHMTCSNCHKGDCENCVDVARLLAGYTNLICQCTKKNHGGEANVQQILDPSTGVVHAPGLEVDRDGKVTRR